MLARLDQQLERADLGREGIAAERAAYAYTKPANALLIDAWYLTAIDIRTGQTAFSKLAGTGPNFNNHYAAIYLGPDGSAYIATLTGMLRFRDTA